MVSRSFVVTYVCRTSIYCRRTFPFLRPLGLHLWMISLSPEVGLCPSSCQRIGDSADLTCGGRRRWTRTVPCWLCVVATVSGEHNLGNLERAQGRGEAAHNVVRTGITEGMRAGGFHDVVMCLGTLPLLCHAPYSSQCVADGCQY